MIKFENTQVIGWDAAIRGMRNPLESHHLSDSKYCYGDPNTEEKGGYIFAGYFDEAEYWIGPNDADLMTRLHNAGADHRKYMRMITVYVDITAPLYLLKELDTYKVGTVSNSCSTMHKIHAKEFTLDDFSHEHMYQETYDLFKLVIEHLNKVRDIYLHGGVLRVGEAPAWFEPKDKEIWWQLIQMLPSSYNQKRTMMLNYEVLANIFKSRKHHKLDEWRIGFMDWIRTLPFSELITGV